MQAKKNISLAMELALARHILNVDSDKGHGGMGASLNGNMRLQLLGLFRHIQLEQQLGGIISTQYLLDSLNINRASLLRLTEKLIELGILKKRKILASHGKGWLFEFFIDLDEETAIRILRSGYNNNEGAGLDSGET